MVSMLNTRFLLSVTRVIVLHTPIEQLSADSVAPLSLALVASKKLGLATASTLAEQLSYTQLPAIKERATRCWRDNQTIGETRPYSLTDTKWTNLLTIRSPFADRSDLFICPLSQRMSESDKS
jgi:hypothetical protein